MSVCVSAWSAPRETAISLRINDQAPTAIAVQMDFDEKNFSGQLLSVRRADLVAQLAAIADPALIEKIRQAEPQNGEWITPASWQDAGIKSRFDDAQVELRLVLEPRFLKVSPLLLTGKPFQPGPFEEISRPASVSALTNIYAGQDFRYGQSTVPSTRMRQPLDVSVDSAVQVESVVLEGNGRYREPGWIRGDLRAVKDFENAMTRVTAGDLSLPVGGFQRFRPLGGVSVVSQFNLQPSRMITPVGNHEVLLAAPSTLRFFLNGRLFQTLSLNAGRYDLRNFPLSPGVNDVVIEITDASGRVERIEVPYLYSEQLLAAGLHRFAYAAGFPSTQTPSSRTYDQKDPNYLLSHALGVSDVWTAGAFSQGDSRRTIFGFTSAHSTPIGTWSVAPALSKVWGESAVGAGYRLAYQWTDHGGPDLSQRNFGIFFEKKTVNLALLGDETRQTQSTDFGGSYGQQLFSRTSASLGASVQSYHHGVERAGRVGRSYTLNAILSRVWVDGLDSSLTFSRSMLSSGEKETSVFLFATWSFPEKRQLLSAAASTEDYARLQWNYQPDSRRVGATGFQAGVETNQDVKKADLRADVTVNRAHLAVEHDSQRDERRLSSHRTGARLATGFFFAAGREGAAFAVGRPAADSFALSKTGGALSGEKVITNPDDRGAYESANGILGPAVTSELTSYRYTALQVVTPEVRPGLNIPKETYLLKPTYRSGTLISLSQAETVYLTGKVTDTGGAPRALWSAEVRGESGFPAQILFTNREGEYALEGLTPGKYALYPGEGLPPIAFEISLPGESGQSHRLEKNFQLSPANKAKEKP